MKKNFPIPQLNQEKWDTLQKYLEDISKLSIEVENDLIEMNNYYNKVRDNLTKLSVSIGLIDHVLGREYPLEVAMDKIKESIKPKTLDDKAKRLFEYQAQIWVLYCDPNLGDYCKSFVDKNGYEVLKDCIVDVFTPSYDLHIYASEHNIPVM